MEEPVEASGAEPAPSQPAPRRRRRPISVGKKLAFSLITVGTICGLTEVAFRFRERVRYFRRARGGGVWVDGEQVMSHGGNKGPREADAYRNLALIPNAHFEWNGQTADINALGMRDDAVAIPKPAGTFRILCIGGSTTYGLYTSSNDKTWPARLEVQLQAEAASAGAKRTVEVLNGGVPAWDLRTSLTNLELRLWDTEPDVVICYHVYNDLMGNHDSRYVDDSRVDDVSELWRPLQLCATYRFLVTQFGPDRSALDDKKTTIRDEGVEAFERNLRRLVRRCREQHARLVFCTFPTALRPTLAESEADGVPGLERWAMELNPFTYEVLLEGIARYNDVVRKVAESEQLPLIDLARDFPHDVDLYQSIMHHSDKGEAKVAELIGRALDASGVLKPSGQ